MVKREHKNGWAAIVRYGGIGDNLIAVSPARALKAQGFKVEFLTSPPAWQVLEHNPFIDKLSVRSRSETPGDWQFWHLTRSEEYERFAHMSHAVECTLAFVPASSQFQWPASVRRSLADRSYLEFAHDIAEVPYEFGPLYFATDEEHAAAIKTKAEVGDKVIGWCLGGTRIDKIYPYSSMAIGRLIKELGASVVLIGSGQKNIEAANAISEHVALQNGSNRGLHVAVSNVNNDNWPLRRSLTFGLHCDLMIGPDTGPMWAAAMEPLPKIMLISHASPKNITRHWINTVTLHADAGRVPCWPCHQLHDSPETCTPNKENLAAACISDISVDVLVRTAANIWTRPTEQLLLAAE